MENNKKIIKKISNSYLLMNIVVGFLEEVNNGYMGEIIKYSF